MGSAQWRVEKHRHIRAVACVRFWVIVVLCLREETKVRRGSWGWAMWFAEGSGQGVYIPTWLGREKEEWHMTRNDISLHSQSHPQTNLLSLSPTLAKMMRSNTLRTSTPPIPSAPTLNPRFDDSSSAALSWEFLMKQARQLETEIQSKLDSFSKMGANSSRHTNSATLSGFQTNGDDPSVSLLGSEAAELEIDELLKKVSSVTAKPGDLLMLDHALYRFNAISDTLRRQCIELYSADNSPQLDGRVSRPTKRRPTKRHCRRPFLDAHATTVSRYIVRLH